MKTNHFKSAAAILAVIGIMAGLSACHSKPDSNTVSEPPSQTVISDITESVPENSTSSHTSESQKSVLESSTSSYTSETQKTEAATPKLEDLVADYNSALENNTLTCSSRTQKIGNGKLWIGDNYDGAINLLAEDQKELLARFEKSDAAGNELTALNVADVESVSVKGNTVTYTLKSSATKNTATNGQGGYINIIDTARTEELVEGVKSFANVKGNVKIESSNYAMSAGKLTVTFNNTNHKKIESVSFSGKQNVKARMKYLVVTINADLDYTLASEYKA